MQQFFSNRGFLPQHDPAWHFSRYPQLQPLDEWGRTLPYLLLDPDFRKNVANLEIPAWPEDKENVETIDELRLYYLRLGFLISAYVNQVSQPKVTEVPANLATPFVKACAILRRPSILSYDGYVLYNWRRVDPLGPVALGNIDTIQNFVNLYDEHWFILVHVAIESAGGEILRTIQSAIRCFRLSRFDELDASFDLLARQIRDITQTLGRIPEHMRPEVYFETFRPYIRFFENITYQGVVDQPPINFRGETGAQSSLITAIDRFLKIPHETTVLTEHLDDMRNYMPFEHRCLLEEIDHYPDVGDAVSAPSFNDVLDALVRFRETHLHWAHEYIEIRTDDRRGTGGTPFKTYLRQMIDETRRACKRKGSSTTLIR